jgi:hypothetical protein
MGGELARLMRRYFAEVATFEADPRDADEYFRSDQPFDETLKQMVGVPVRCPEDALAGVEWLIDLGRGCMIDLSGGSSYYNVAGSIVNELRDYLAKEVRS